MDAADRATLDDAPVQGFADCHAGIVAQLERLQALPALAEQAARARRTAAELHDCFRDVILVHHADEERELFPAVVSSACQGAERDQVRSMVDRLTTEHRRLEDAWRALGLPALAHGRDAALDAAAVSELVARYRAHAAYEEAAFLPLARAILGRDGNHMAALGLSLHMRHAMPEVLRRFGSWL